MGEWIKCSNAQPVDGQCALVFDVRETHSKIYTMQFSDHSIACIRGDEFSECFVGITHWMSLPEPPRDE